MLGPTSWTTEACLHVSVVSLIRWLWTNILHLIDSMKCMFVHIDCVAVQSLYFWCYRPGQKFLWHFPKFGEFPSLNEGVWIKPCTKNAFLLLLQPNNHFHNHYNTAGVWWNSQVITKDTAWRTGVQKAFRQDTCWHSAGESHTIRAGSGPCKGSCVWWTCKRGLILHRQDVRWQTSPHGRATRLSKLCRLHDSSHRQQTSAAWAHHTLDSAY